MPGEKPPKKPLEGKGKIFSLLGGQNRRREAQRVRSIVEGRMERHNEGVEVNIARDRLHAEGVERADYGLLQSSTSERREGPEKPMIYYVTQGAMTVTVDRKLLPKKRKVLGRGQMIRISRGQAHTLKTGSGVCKYIFGQVTRK